jgi:hypothetical protein
MRLMDSQMAALVLIVLTIASVLAADCAFVAYRDWRARRLAAKHGRTLTAKFSLPR